MADAHTVLGEQFTEMPQQREAATLGMWTFLATELLFFGTMFMGYITYRHAYPAAFVAASHHTNLFFGTLNTALLLTSGLTMVLAVQAGSLGKNRGAFRLLILTLLLGLAFLAVKGFEYRTDLTEHLWPGPRFRTDLPREAQIFWFLYWVMTGLHAVHLSVGVGLLAVMAWMTARGRFSPAYYTPLEMSGLYWAFVDIIWMYLYPLLYLIHRYSA